MKGSQFFIDVDRAKTPAGRKCNSCQDKIPQGAKYLHMNRNTHLFVLCGKCLLIYAAKVNAHDPSHKTKAVSDLLRK
jgi:hypothetical protein